MDTQNIENTLKKMGLVLEKLVQKVDELDKRVSVLESNTEKKFSSGDFQAQQQKTPTTGSTSNASLGGFGSSFLGSLTGAMAGMGLYNLLFNHNVSPVEMGENLGMDEKEIDQVLQSDMDEIENKLDEIDAKLDELDDKLSDTNEDIMSNEYYENYEDEVSDNDFEGGYSDFDGLDDFGGFDGGDI